MVSQKLGACCARLLERALVSFADFCVTTLKKLERTNPTTYLIPPASIYSLFQLAKEEGEEETTKKEA